MNYLTEIKQNNPYIWNSWRSFKYTKKGRDIGVEDSWNSFLTFYWDVQDGYFPNARLVRKDKAKPFGPHNFIWLSDEDLQKLKDNATKLTYNNKTQTLREWANELELSYNGLRSRYYKHKGNWTVEQLLFGKVKLPAKLIIDATDIPKDKLRSKASKMISSYKLKDRKKGFNTDIDIDWFIANVLNSKCVYCGDTKRLGCDRIDNSKGHTKDNVVPCCYECNIARGNNFTHEETIIIGQAIRKIKEQRNN